jgi:L-lysine 2,3-aminomutase
MHNMVNVTLRTDTATPPSGTPNRSDWQSALAAVIDNPVELCRLLDLPTSRAAEAAQAASGFSLRVPREFLTRIGRGNPQDPLLLQILPQAAEQTNAPGYSTDPCGEAGTTCSGLLSKYQGRSLIVTTGGCAVHCRVCFRRYFTYRRGASAAVDGEAALQRIAAEPSTHEVILSGGDPLTLPDAELARLAQRLAAIPHLQRLRVHTRLPIMIPQRVTGELLAWLRGTRLASLVVVHVNHPAEIDAAVAAALGRLLDAGIPVLSQSVLLRGVNDRVEVLAALYETLADLRVIPYYLHQLDPVAGAAHFEVAEATGIALINALRARLPGYAVPRYVRETRGGVSKQILA